MNFLLNRRITICMLFIALSLLGYVSYKQLPVELLPNAELPVLFVQDNPWDLLQPRDVTSRHRGAKPLRRYELLGDRKSVV